MGRKGRAHGLPAGFPSQGFIVQEATHPCFRLGRQKLGAPKAFHKQTPLSGTQVRWGLQHEQQGPHLEGRKGELQAGIPKGQVASRITLFQEVAEDSLLNW